MTFTATNPYTINHHNGVNITNQLLPFSIFLDEFRKKLNKVFYERSDINNLSLRRGLPPFVLREIMSCNPLSVGIPTSYGGRGGYIHENLAILAAASYESLALSLTLGINSALFLQPVAKYGNENIKASIFKKFLHDKNMGGLMITEPDHGSDALAMETFHTYQNGHYHIDGTKHWGGLTGWADFWLLTARQQTKDKGLKRDIDFFICDVNSPGQNIVVEEFFENSGLLLIPYGRNRIDVEIPEIQRLQPQTTGVKMMIDLLHRSRMHYPGMGMGFIKRMLDEALDHCKMRYVGGKNLISYDQVQGRISRLQSSYTICSAFCVQSSDKAALNNDLSANGIEANTIKSVTADMMQEAAQSLLQLVGAKGYKTDHIAGRAIMDSRPFQIFEGSNDILYMQITESVMKLMKGFHSRNLLSFMKDYNLTSRASDYCKDLLSFNIDTQLTQRKLVELGQIISRTISMNFVIQLGDSGYKKDLITNAIHEIHLDITALVSVFSKTNHNKIIDNYQENSSWLNYLPT